MKDVFKKWFAHQLRIAYIRQSPAGHLFTFQRYDAVDVAFAAKHDKVLSELIRKTMEAQTAVDHYIIDKAGECPSSVVVIVDNQRKTS